MGNSLRDYRNHNAEILITMFRPVDLLDGSARTRVIKVP